MVVGMQHQQQQPYASPATVLEDASTPCALSPQSPAAMPCTVSKDRQDQASVDECSSTTSNMPCEPLAPDIAQMEAAVMNGCDDDADDGGKDLMSSVRGRVKLRDINEHLICFLCEGYFVDATSITECLHTFCRSCIILHLATKNHCPKCEIEINNSKPHLSLKPDKTLQDIVYKLVPGLFHAEMKRRNQFYLDKPDRDTHLHPEFRGISVDRLVYSPHDTICLSLEYYDNKKEKEDWQNVGAHRVSSKPLTFLEDKLIQDIKDNDSIGKNVKHFKCPAAVRIMHLKKLIQLKYNLDIKHKVELFHRRESLPDDYSLMDIAYIYAWKRNSPLRLYYRISLPKDDSEFLQRRLFLASIFEEKSSQSTAVVPGTDACETKVKSPTNDCWRVKSPLRTPRAEPISASSSVVPGINQSPKSQSTDGDDSLIKLPSVCEPSFQEVTKCSGSQGTKVSATGTTVSVTLPSSKPKVSLTTTAVHTTPKISSKLKYYSDSKKHPKPVKTPVLNPNQTTPEKSSSNAIKSYLTISSILNEPEPKKSPLAKVARSCAVVKERLDDVKTSPTAIESSRPTTESAVLFDGTIEPLAVPPVTSNSVSSTGITTADVSPAVSTTEPKNSKLILSAAKQSVTKIPTSTSAAAPSLELAASKPVQPSSTPLTPASTALPTSSHCDKNPTSVSNCAISGNTESTVGSELNVTSTNTLVVTSTSLSTVCSNTASDSVPVKELPQSQASGNTASAMPKKAVTNPTASTTKVKVATSVAPASSIPPPLITLKSIPAPKISLPPLKPRPVQPSFILANTKIPSSLEISLTQSSDTRAASSSPVLSLQKMVTQNFAANSVDSVAKSAIKRPFIDVDEPPTVSISKASNASDEKKKLGLHNEITLTTNDTAPAKKIFSPNILPEVSITLNPHPDRPTKRITPETSFDVTCFKPSEKKEPVTNGIPSLTPIAKHTSGSSAIRKNIQNSPIKNLNTKSLRTPQRNSCSPKNRPRPFLVCDLEMKKRKLNGVDTDSANRAVENGGTKVEARVNGIAPPAQLPEAEGSILCRPQVNAKGNIEKKSSGAATSASSGPKKEGARHQGIPQLIDITTPRYTQLMAAAAAAQNAKMRSAQHLSNKFSSALHVKLPSSDESAVTNTGAALDLSSPSSCDKSSPTAPTSIKSSESPPDKKKLIQSMPPLMIPVTLSSRVDSKLSPSAQSIAKIERRVSPIAKMLDRKSDAPTTPSKGSPTGANASGRRSGGGAGDSLLRSVPFSTNGHSSSSNSVSPSSRVTKTPPSSADARHTSPSNGASLSSPLSGAKSPLTSSPTFMSMQGAASYHATMLHLMQMQQLQQNWLSKVRDPVPPHPLMFDHSKPSTSQESLFNFKK